MKVLTLSLAAVLALTPVASAELYVTTEWDGLLCDELYPFRDPTCAIKIANPDTISVDSMVLVFTFEKPDVGYLAHIGTSYENNFESYWTGWGTQVLDEDSVLRIIVQAFTWEGYGSGLPSSSDTLTYITLTFDYSIPGNEGSGPICFDSSETAEWQWSLGPTQTAVWSGPECLETNGWIPNCCYVEFTRCPWELSSWSWSEKLSYWLNAESGLYVAVRYILQSGPGSVDWYNGRWTYYPTEEDAGTQDTVVIQAVEDWCGDSSYIRYPYNEESWCTFAVNVGTHGPPQFTAPYPHFVHSSVDTFEVTLDLEDGNPCNGCVWSYWTSPEDPVPPGYFDSSNGTFYYTGTEADTGLYFGYMTVDQNGYTDTSGFYLHHFTTYTCGDIDHSSGSDIADLVWLVDFMFSGGPSPVPLASGNVDCIEGLDISDLVYYVDWMFLDGPAPCEGCP